MGELTATVGPAVEAEVRLHIERSSADPLA